MIEIVELSERVDLLDDAVQYIWGKWGNARNLPFYKDSIIHALDPNVDLSKFYLALQGNTIIGTYALLRNDLISRQDLVPWLGCLYVNPDARGRGLGSVMLRHALEQARSKGYAQVYLSTNLEQYYEKYGWSYIGQGYYFNGDATKMYARSTAQSQQVNSSGGGGNGEKSD